MALFRDEHKRRAGIDFLALTVVAFGLNCLPLRLFFQVDFLFGSVATLLVARYYGPWLGLFAGAAASLPTYWLWGHPYAIAIFACEAFAVGFLHRRRWPVPVADALYWIVLGMPSVLLFYRGVMSMPWDGSVLIMLKQALNGIANALLANAAFLLSIRLRPGDASAPRPPLLEWVFTGASVVVLGPVLFFLVVESRTAVQQVEEQMELRINAAIESTARQIGYWYERKAFAVERLRDAVAGRLDSPEVLQRECENTRRFFPDLLGVYVADPTGTAIAFSPVTNASGQANIGANYSHRAYYKKLVETQRLVVSEAVVGRSAITGPFQTISAPIVRDGQFAGYTCGVIDLNHLRRLLHSPSLGGIDVTLLDSKGRVLAATDETARPLQDYDTVVKGSYSTIRSNLFLRAPVDSLPEMKRWSESYFGSRSSLAGWPVTIVAESPVAPMQHRLYAAYVKNFLLGILSFLLAGLVAYALTRALARPIAQLAAATSSFSPESTEQRSWPVCFTAELCLLTENFRKAFEALQHSLAQLREHSGALTEKNSILNQEVTRRKQIEEGLREKEKMLRVFNRVLVELSLQQQFSLRLEDYFRPVTERLAEALNVERASIWLFDQAGTRLICRDLFELSRNAHSAGPELLAADYPAYFAALAKERAIPAADAENDPRTREFTENYLRKLGITSMLDAPIRLGGKLIGVVCNEHVGTPRTWTQEEESFSGSIGDFVALCVQNHQASIEHARYSGELEHQIQERTHDLQSSIRELESFCYSVSHDLRAPLRAMSGYAEFLLDDFGPALSPTGRQYIESIRGAAARMDQLINDLLDYSRLNHTKLGISKVDPGQILEKVRATHRDEIERTGAELAFPEELPPVLANPTALEQVFGNLIGNALKFVPPGRKARVEVGATATGSKVVFSIKDNGIGIRPEHRAKIFGLFQRLHGDGDYAGTGIGLAIVSKALERMGGRVWVESEPGAGSTFHFEVKRA